MIAVVIGVAAGALLSAVHLALLRRQARVSVPSDDWKKIVFHSVLRLIAVGGILLLIAQAGAPMLLGALIGFLLARSAALARTVFRHG